MLKFWINYKILVRKLYTKRVRGRSASADNLTFMLIVMQFFTLMFLLEGIFDVKGFTYVSLHLNIPMAPFAMAVFTVLYFIARLLFPFNYNSDSIALIRACYNSQVNINQKTALILLVFTVLLFMLSILLMLIS